MSPRRSLALLALLIAGCGGPGATTATPSTLCPTPTAAPPPQTAQPPFAARADTARVDPGGTVTFTEVITGPAAVHAVACGGPLQVVVSTSAGLQVYDGSAAAVTGGRCDTVTVPAGAQLSYQVSWPVDPSLPGGVYTVSLVLGDAPTLTLSLAVGALPGGC